MLPGKDFSTDQLIRLALMHRVTGQFYQYVRHHPGIFSDEQLELLDKRVKQNASRSLLQLHELLRICREFNRSGLSYACMKGPQLAKMIYGREALKESVDLDIMLVNESELETAHRVLIELGYDQSNLHDYKSRFAKKIFLLGKREVHYFNAISGCHVDLHIRAAANAYLTAGRFRDLFTDLQSYDLEGIPVPVLPPEKYLVFLCYHGALHQFGRLGWLMDIRFFIINMAKELDFNKVEWIARSLGTERALFLVFILLKEIFGTEMAGSKTGGNGTVGNGTFTDEMASSAIDILKHNRSIRYMIGVSERIWSRDASYTLGFRGRLERFIYLVMLSKDFAAKIDLIAGILTRNLLPVMRWLRS